MLKVFRSAIISDDDKYRYLLVREWNSKKPKIVIIGINPSTADGYNDDPTISRLTKFAMRSGYGGLIMLNLFAYRSSKPGVLRAKLVIADISYIQGPENDKYIKANLKRTDKVVCMWGKQGNKISAARVQQVYDMIPAEKRFCFGFNNDDSPTHPLYSPSPLTLKPFNLLKTSPSD